MAPAETHLAPGRVQTGGTWQDLAERLALVEREGNANRTQAPTSPRPTRTGTPPFASCGRRGVFAQGLAPQTGRKQRLRSSAVKVARVAEARSTSADALAPGRAARREGRRCGQPPCRGYADLPPSWSFSAYPALTRRRWACHWIMLQA